MKKGRLITKYDRVIYKKLEWITPSRIKRSDWDAPVWWAWTAFQDVSRDSRTVKRPFKKSLFKKQATIQEHKTYKLQFHYCPISLQTLHHPERRNKDRMMLGSTQWRYSQHCCWGCHCNQCCFCRRFAVSNNHGFCDANLDATTHHDGPSEICIGIQVATCTTDQTMVDVPISEYLPGPVCQAIWLCWLSWTPSMISTSPVLHNFSVSMKHKTSSGAHMAIDHCQ